MLKKVMAASAATVSLVGASAMLAPQAMAIGNHDGSTSFSGNGAKQAFGNSKTEGDMSPQLSLVQGSLNKPCLGVPVKGNAAAIVGFVPVSVLQDVPVLSAPQNQQCTENSTQAKGDEPLSHILNQIPILSSNGAGSR
ncbi:rodlin [Streptomyces sp. NPDC006692]|uniref:rodlin n=1 Tax=unclassified Streptomyces TaxID=2593676 RepID=UPI002E3402F7|nr:rodlin [Streptomyces sp. NBC_01431]